MKKQYGHPMFYDLTKQEEILYNIKNHDYAAGGNPLGNFDRVAAIEQLYPGMDWASPEGVTITYLLKQFDAALWIMLQGHEAKVEGPIKRWQDVSVYAKIIMIHLITKSKK
jgi:hypothetical protein